MATTQAVLEHFQKADPVIYSVLKTIDLQRWKKDPVAPEQYFFSLVNQIVSQQLSTKVADVISERLTNLIGAKPYIPATLLGITDEDLRTVGLSRAKITYIKNLAIKVLEGELKLELLPTQSEEQVVSELTKVKGIGKWTAEMFLIFSLGKEDIFSHGDWGLKSALKKLYNLDEYPTEAEAEEITAAWKPYRSYGSYALWQSLEK